MATSIGTGFFLFGFAAAALLVAYISLRTVSITRPVFDWIGAMFGILAAVVMTMDGLQLLDSLKQYQPWSHLLLLAGVLGYSWLCLHCWTWRGKKGLAFIQQPLVICLLLTTVGLSAWSWRRLHFNNMLMEFSMNWSSPGQVVEEPRFVAFTDTGSLVPLYRLDVSEELYERYALESKERVAMLADPLIVRAEPTSDSNCHGWVFTGGKFLMRGENVKQILADNGYTQVTLPEENDIIIYRTSDGGISHTGLVKTVLSDRTILIESKWGVDGRFLHRPENQPYSQEFEYYRCSRPSHLITVKSTRSVGAHSRLSAARPPVTTNVRSFGS